MEANICDTNHLDSDVLLPPRKRLLAGLKKQSYGADVAHDRASIDNSSSLSSEFNVRLNNLLTSHSNNHNISPEDILEASRSAARNASRAAQAARSAAEEKATIASKAIAAAKSALDLVASMSEEAADRKRGLKRNKLKKHVPVQLLYKKQQPVENFKKDEELARKLHRTINSSPRISKNSSSLESGSQKHKKPKYYHSERIGVCNGSVVLDGNPVSLKNGHREAADVDSEGSIEEVYMFRGDNKAIKLDTGDQSDMENEEADTSQSKDRASEDVSLSARKRGRVKLKKLPLSICNFRDQSNPKEEVSARSSMLTEKISDKPNAIKMCLFPMEPLDGLRSVEATSVRKCQESSVPPCIEQNKAVQS